MPDFRPLYLCSLLTLIPVVALAQASPGPLPTSAPISDMDRLMREKDTNERFFNKPMVTLNLTYNGAGDLKSSLIKHEGHSVFMTVQVNGQKIKGIAKSEKPKVQEAVKAGPLNVTGRWARPGTRRETRCTGELTVGFHKIIFLPFGGIDSFSCYVEMRNLPEETYTEWQAGFDADQTGAYGECASKHPRGSGEFWSCIDGAGIPFPAA